MKKIEGYETRSGKSRHTEVKINCEYCGKEKWVRWIRVKKGQGRFCGKVCSDDFQRDEGKKTWGKENVKFHWSEDRNCWYAYWADKETGKFRSTTKARFLWEESQGKLSSKYVVAYKDGNPRNCVHENLHLITRSESNAIHLIGHKVTDEARANMSKAHKGKILSEEHRQKIGEWTKSRWEDGTFGSDEHLSKLRGKSAWNEGISPSDETRKKMSNSQIRRYEDPKEVERHRESQLRGSDHPNWRGGMSDQKYPAEFSKPLRRKIRTRDLHKCRICHILAKGADGKVHHIDADKNNNDIENLVLLCHSCHGAVHAKYKTDNIVILTFRSKLYE